MTVNPDLYGTLSDLLAEYGPRIATPGTAWHCTELTGHLLGRFASPGTRAPLPAFAPGSRWWQQINVWDPSDPYSPLRAAEAVAEAIGTVHLGSGIVEPVAPRDLPTLRPGVYLVQGWRVLPSRQASVASGHAFLVEVQPGGQYGRIVESSQSRGLRVASNPWRGGDLPAPESLALRLAPYVDGVGFALLWPGRPVATAPMPTGERVSPQPAPPPPPPTEDDDMGRVQMTEEQKVDFWDTLDAEWKELQAAGRDGSLTAGRFVEGAFDIAIKGFTLLIPGQYDDMAVAMFRTQLDTLKRMISGAIDGQLGTDQDPEMLLARASDYRDDAKKHLEKAGRKEAQGKLGGGLFRRSPEEHRERARELIILAETDEARAAALLATSA